MEVVEAALERVVETDRAPKSRARLTATMGSTTKGVK